MAVPDGAKSFGPTGLHSKVWLTQDDIPVLTQSNRIPKRVFRRDIQSAAYVDLPPELLCLPDLLKTFRNQHHISLEVMDDRAFGVVLACVRQFQEKSGLQAIDRVWITHHDWHLLASWRQQDGQVRLVNKCRLLTMTEGPERRAAQLQNAGITSVNMQSSDWKRGLVVLFRKFNLLSFAWDAKHERIVDALLSMDIDGIYSDRFSATES